MSENSVKISRESISHLSESDFKRVCEIIEELQLSEIPDKGKVKTLIEQSQKDYDYYNAMQLALKLALNGSYGAFIEKSFACYNADIANSITAMGRTIIKYCHQVSSDYWQNKWHLDYELHEKLGIDSSKVKPIVDGEEITAYGDTDSILGDSKIISESYGEVTIASYFDMIAKAEGVHGTMSGHNYVTPLDRAYSFDPITGEPTMTRVNRVIRREVNKQLYRITTVDGESIVVTEDHSCVVWREGVMMVVKPAQILDSDDVLILVR